MIERLFILFIILINFFTPQISFVDPTSILYIILPYLKDQVVSFLISIYFVYIFLNHGKILLPAKNDKLFLLVIYFFIYYIISLIIVISDLESFTYLSAFSISNLLFCFLMFIALYNKVNIDKLFMDIVFFIRLFTVLLFIELISTFVFPNPYSFSSYSGAFVSAFILDLNTVSIITNLSFGFALYSILTKNKYKIFNYLILIFSIIVCYYTYNRTAIIINGFLFVFMNYYVHRFNKTLGYITFTAIVSIFLFLFTPIFEVLNVKNQNFDDAYTLYLRLLLIYIGFGIFVKNFFFGVGPFLINDNMWSEIKSFHNDSVFNSLTYLTDNTTLYSGKWMTNPHFAFLNLILSFGIISILFYSYIIKLFVWSFKNRFKHIKLGYPLVGLFVIFAHSTMYPQINVDYYIMFSVVVIYYKNSMYKKYNSNKSDTKVKNNQRVSNT
jgi:hypothetical protein